MAHTFDIRFARSSGLAALFQSPTNTFRWKGAGRLSIDAEGISIAVRRGVHSLFTQTRRVPAADLMGVLREGEALRVEFATTNNLRAVVPFWVRDQETAEEIVRLLPTSRTVELNHDAAGIAHAQGRIDWRALSLCAVAVVAIAASVRKLQRSDAPVLVVQTVAEPAMPETSIYPEPLVDAAAEASGKPADLASAAPSAASQTTAGGDLPVELRPPDPYASATEAAGDSPELTSAESMTTPTAEDLRAYEVEQRSTGMTPRVAVGHPLYQIEAEIMQLVQETRTGVSHRPSLDAAWWRITVLLYNEGSDSRLRNLELAVSRAWRDYIYLRDIGHPGAEFALEFAERLTAQIPGYTR